ncbi:hypothetical protein L3Y34_001206 [Caenorhabditis briggsae]|uniref:Uncharacterized protein n=1 Tax=Caenorhabditis briggsae TaxID=6238 RepID=A0AAE9IPA7_CAEBR|nr:hypothetical protein L3Y34_001206 [Caenorhabditis briggsae]
MLIAEFSELSLSKTKKSRARKPKKEKETASTEPQTDTKPRRTRKRCYEVAKKTGSGIATKIRKARKRPVNTNFDQLMKKFSKLRIAPARRGRKPKIVVPAKTKVPRKPRAPRRKSQSVDVLCNFFGKLCIDTAKIKKRPRKSAEQKKNEVVDRLKNSLHIGSGDEENL